MRLTEFEKRKRKRKGNTESRKGGTLIKEKRRKWVREGRGIHKWMSGKRRLELASEQWK